jgi:hypothetical protein
MTPSKRYHRLIKLIKEFSANALIPTETLANYIGKRDDLVKQAQARLAEKLAEALIQHEVVSFYEMTDAEGVHIKGRFFAIPDQEALEETVDMVRPMHDHTPQTIH